MSGKDDKVYDKALRGFEKAERRAKREITIWSKLPRVLSAFVVMAVMVFTLDRAVEKESHWLIALVFVATAVAIHVLFRVCRKRDVRLLAGLEARTEVIRQKEATRAAKALIKATGRPASEVAPHIGIATPNKEFYEAVHNVLRSM